VFDFSFIHDRVAGFFCPHNGRPPLDPTLMFKALFVGYPFGVRSERQLAREIEVNVAYLGPEAAADRSGVRRLDAEPEPAGVGATTIQLRRISLMRSWNRQCREAGNSRYDTVVVAKSRADYWEALEYAKANQGAFSTSITGAWTAGSASLPIPMRLMIRSSTSAGSIVSDNALILASAPLGWMPVMPPQGLFKEGVTAAAQNIKKIALAMLPPRSPQPPNSRLLKLPTSKTKPAENRRVCQRSEAPRRRLFNST
jgi:Transposase domain (DUF772)